MMRGVTLFYFVTIILAYPAWAHKPIIVGSPVTGPDNPIQLESTDVSQVAYHEKTDAAPEIWLRFDANAGDTLFIQLGVPKIDRLQNLRPSMALVGPSLPQAKLPFGIPSGLGALTFPTDSVLEPETFEEPFTGTTSWQYPGHTVTLPEAGTYYLVGYLPNDDTGKFWMVLGEREEFGLEDILSLPAIVVDVRKFHEVFPLGGVTLIVPILLLFFALIKLLFISSD